MSFLQSYSTVVEKRFLKNNDSWIVSKRSRTIPQKINYDHKNIWYWCGEKEDWLCKNIPNHRYNFFTEMFL